MAKIESAFFEINYLETLATGTTFVHRLDPRIKVLIAIFFVICVISFEKYAIAAMLPYALFLVLVSGFADVPLSYLIKKLILVSPFAVMVGIFNPIFDHEPLLQLGHITFSGGWISFFSIILRFVLTVSTGLMLIATTGFHAVCMAIEKMGVPKIFAVQLLLLYRYIFVLIDESLCMHRARTLRTFQRGSIKLRSFSQMIGQLLLRTLDRAQRIHLAMLCRGFDGTIHIRQALQIKIVDTLVFIGCLLLFILMRFYDLPQLLGNLISGVVL